MMLFGDTESTVACPVPEREIAEIPPTEFVAKLICPVRSPIAEGVKVTLSEQVAVGASEVPQLFVCA